MTRRASVRAAFMIAGFLLAAMTFASAEPSDNESVVAQRGEKPGKPIALIKPAAAKKIARHRARVKLAARSRKAVVVAAKPERRKSVEAKAEVKGGAALALPALVANARAQLPGASASAGTSPLEIAAADQMNELDRALSAALVKIDDPSQAVTPIAQIPQPAVAITSPTSYAQASNNRPWDESTLIGKIFLAFGGVLTLASAARMLIA